VGDTCLTELAKGGAVLRRFGRESGQKAYEIEMESRTQESEEVPQGQRIRSHPTSAMVLGKKLRRRSGTKCVRGPTKPASANLEKIHQPGIADLTSPNNLLQRIR